MVLKTVLGAKPIHQIACMGQGEVGRIGSFSHEETETVASVRPRVAFCSVKLPWFCYHLKTTHTQLLYF